MRALEEQTVWYIPCPILLVPILQGALWVVDASQSHGAVAVLKVLEAAWKGEGDPRVAVKTTFPLMWCWYRAGSMW